MKQEVGIQDAERIFFRVGNTARQDKPTPGL